MKKKIAVLANGWNNLSVAEAIKGIKSCADELNIDLFLFLSYASYGMSKERTNGENSVFDITDYTDFDGVIIFSSMLNSSTLHLKIGEKLKENNVHAVSVGAEIPGIDYIGVNNFQGMYELVTHLIKRHGVKNPVFLAGPKQNADSNERIEATRQALEDNGFKLDESRIRYTDWEYNKALEAAQEFASPDKLPDAFICANDNIAIAASIGLQNKGIFIPDQTIVTGFDKISYADVVYPSITTVYQNYEKIGYVAIWHLLEKIEGTAQINRIIVSANWVRNESCGCKASSEAEKLRREFCTNAYSQEMKNIYFLSHTTDIANVIFNRSDFSNFKADINEFYKNNHSYEGDDFYFVLDSATVKAFTDTSFPLKKHFSKTMQSIVAMKNGEIQDFNEFNRNDVIPGYEKKDKSVVYIISSLHYDDNLFGYLVMKDAVEAMRDTSHNHYMMQMNYNLEKYRQNNHLEEMNKALQNISVKDSLSGLYNRHGLEQIGIPLFEKACKDKKSCAIVFSDINRMKYINDNFGHLQGDLAIRTVSAALLSQLPDNWIAIRYGGDEFIALGVSSDENLINDFVYRMNENLKKQVESMQLSYPLTISCGYILTDFDGKAALEDYIKKADEVMYVQKQKAHKESASR